MMRLTEGDLIAQVSFQANKGSNENVTNPFSYEVVCQIGGEDIHSQSFTHLFSVDLEIVSNIAFCRDETYPPLKWQ